MTCQVASVWDWLAEPIWASAVVSRRQGRTHGRNRPGRKISYLFACIRRSSTRAIRSLRIGAGQRRCQSRHHTGRRRLVRLGLGGPLSALSPTQLKCPSCRLFRGQPASPPIAACPGKQSEVHTGGGSAHAHLQRRGWGNPGDLSARADQGNRGCYRHQKPVVKHSKCATRPRSDGRGRRPGAGSRR
jgi:hypothetical protein